jgi:hypothetical protein
MGYTSTKKRLTDGKEGLKQSLIEQSGSDSKERGNKPPLAPFKPPLSPLKLIRIRRRIRIRIRIRRRESYNKRQRGGNGVKTRWKKSEMRFILNTK